MFDPINRREIPNEWVLRSKIPKNVLKKRIESGELVLLPDGRVLKRGFTTGTTAAAAAKSAILSVRKNVDKVSVMTPSGIRVELPVESSNGVGTARKAGGDHEFDVTDGVKIRATATLKKEGITIKAGKGIGRFKDGRPAINPSPMKSIKIAVREALDTINEKGAEILIEVENGEKLAKKTLNPAYGVLGGISILGTTGFVEPWNEHLEEMVKSLIERSSKVALTTGRRGAEFARQILSEHEVIIIGSRFEIIESISKETTYPILCGLPALILKWGNPDILKSTGFKTVREMVMNEPAHESIDQSIEAIKKRHPYLNVILFNFDGNILRDTR
ncbi:Cobalt-precorrin-5B C(1)-methyltransferase [Candidatus Methanoperedenaceae archaeon GB37]|nr:Cobalt-precorrin-5B C(1)-methyltransferase [Candidatus Methanoperedenaceae archaeon GB37]